MRRKELHSFLSSNKGKERYLALCFVDPVLWFNTALWTFNSQSRPGYRDIPFILWPHQEKAVRAIKVAIDKGMNGEPTDLFFLKSRKQGATYIILGMYLLYFLVSPNSKFLLGSRKEQLVDDGCELVDGVLVGSEESLFYKFLYMINTLPEYLQPKTYKKKLFIQSLDNNSAVRGDTTNIGFGKSFRSTSVMVDEAAQIEPPMASWLLENLADTSECCIFNSTKGPWGGAHPYDRAMAAHPDNTIKLSFFDCPNQNYGRYSSPKDGQVIMKDLAYFQKAYPGVYDDVEEGEVVDTSTLGGGYSFIADAGVSNFGIDRTVWLDSDEKRPGRTERGKAQNILCLDSGSTETFFDFSLMSKLRERVEEPRYRGDIIYVVSDKSISDVEFVLGGSKSLVSWWGELKYGRPLQGHSYAVGADLSRGTGASNSVCAVKDVNTDELVGLLVTAYHPRPSFAELTVAFCDWIGGSVPPLLNWEENGAPEFYERLDELGYYSLYKREGAPNSTRKWANAYGWKNTTGQSGTKISMLNKLDAALRESLRDNPQFSRLILYDNQTMNEMEGYTFADKRIDVGPVSMITESSGAKASHGDRVIAMGLAEMASSQQAKGSEEEYRIIHPGSFAARMRDAEMIDYRRTRDEKQWV